MQFYGCYLFYEYCTSVILIYWFISSNGVKSHVNDDITTANGHHLSHGEDIPSRWSILISPLHIFVLLKINNNAFRSLRYSSLRFMKYFFSYIAVLMQLFTATCKVSSIIENSYHYDFCNIWLNVASLKIWFGMIKYLNRW